MVKPRQLSERIYMNGSDKRAIDKFEIVKAGVEKSTYARSLNQLMDRHKNVPDYMAELFLNEIRLSTDLPNAQSRREAMLLGLMPFDQKDFDLVN